MKYEIRHRIALSVLQIDGNELTDPDISAPVTPLQKTKKRVLLLFDELPGWAKDNKYILSGWRPETNSYWECIKSMGYIHNESGNIYTHLLAAIWMAILGFWWTAYAKERYPATNFDDTLVFFLFFLGGIVCYLFSATYHVLSNHSHGTHIFCLKLDFLGISTVTAGCFMPGLWYTFPCTSRQMKLTLIAVGIFFFFCYPTPSGFFRMPK
jgi:adiponectin receptor